MSNSSSEYQDEQRKFGLLLSIRWVIFFITTIFIAFKTFSDPLFPLYYHWVLGVFLLTNLFYSLLYISKATYLSMFTLPSLILDFIIIFSADFLSGGLFNHLGIIFYLFLISGSSIVISYQFSLLLTLTALVSNLLLFFLHLYKLYPSSLILDDKGLTSLLSSLLEREALIIGLIFLLRYFISSEDQKFQTFQKEKEEIGQILESFGNGLLLLDSEGKVLTGNRQVEELIGAKISSLRGKILFADSNIFPYTLDFPQINPVSWIDEVKKTRSASQLEFKVLLPLEERHVRATLAPISSSKTTSGMVVLLEDITEAKRLEEAKSDFISAISHELRTPLTTIKGYVSLLLNPKSQFNEEKRKEFLKAIERQADKLAQMINELLDVSRIEAGRIELKKQPVSLENLIKKVIANFHLSVRRRTFQVNFSPELPLINIDPERIEQVFNNIIDNALKYSPPDKPVIIKGWREKNRILVMVEDFGPGIAPSEIPYIFEKFHRVDRKLTREVEGTGLGLYIAKNLVEAHEGEIWVESKVNQGSKFFVVLPIFDRH